jgi:hypothetical protein
MFVILDRLCNNDANTTVETGYELADIAKVAPHKEINACWILDHSGATLSLVRGSVRDVCNQLNAAEKAS